MRLHLWAGLAVLALTACGTGAAGDASATGSASGTTSGSASGIAACEPTAPPSDDDLVVTLDEWSITPATETVPAGPLTMVGDNVGEEPHEIVVVRADDPGALPVDADGVLDEAALHDGALLGEIEPFPAGSRCPGTFDLQPGTYTLLCNIVEQEDGQTESHLAEGMVTTLTVRS